jgi:hypothetical protein
MGVQLGMIARGATRMVFNHERVGATVLSTNRTLAIRSPRLSDIYIYRETIIYA